MLPKTDYGIHRGQPRSVSIHQHLTGRSLQLKRLLKTIGVVIAIGMVNSLLATAIVHWRIEEKNIRLTQLQELRTQIVNENIALLSQRAKLLSRERIEQVAAQKLHLFPPDPEQIKKL